MASIDFVLDTEPMAREISTVSKRVDRTTTAVVAMQTAVVAAETEGANHVCKNVNRGFYSLIHSQISQKIAKLRSEVDSYLMQLNQQRRQLNAIQHRMTRDYNRICDRYQKLFGQLDKNLSQSIYEVDKPVVDLVQKEMTRTSNRSTSLPATVPVMQEESLATSQRIVASKIKVRSLQAINAMNNFIDQMQSTDRLTQRVLIPLRLDVDARVIAMPAIMMETNFDRSDATIKSVYANPAYIQPRDQEQLKMMIDSGYWGQWGYDPQGVDANVVNEFSRMVEEAPMSPRAKDMARWLFGQSQYQTLNDGSR